MTDLRTLLRESAPTPRQPLDLAELHRRADRRGTRRWLTWIAGLGAVLGLAGPVGVGVLSPADEGDSRVGVGPVVTTSSTVASASASAVASASTTTTTTTTRRGTGAGARATSAKAADRPSDAGAPADPVVGSSERSTAPGPADRPAPATATAGNPDYPEATACTVDDVGLGPGEERRCRFTATTNGGASLRSDGPASPDVGVRGEVIITRGRTTTRREVQYQSVRAGDVSAFAGCDKFIEPGDLVEVVLTNSTSPAESGRTTLGAGEGWACYE